MANSKLEYWTGSVWTEAQTIEGDSALIRLEIDDSLNNATKVNAVLGNAAQEPFREGTAAHADRYGPLTSVFTDFMPIRIIETDSNVVLFHGRVYDIKNVYDKARGNVVKLYARDHLAELADFPTDDKDAEIKVGTGSSPEILKRSALIKHIIRDENANPQRSSLQISANNIAFDDALKFPASGRAFSTDHKDSYKINTLGKQGLKAVYEIAKNDPHEITGDITDYGYDFYADSQFVFNTASPPITATNPAADFNYFKRGTRPAFESTPADFKGLTVEYPIATEFTETGNSILMLPDYDFNLPKRDLYTGATAAVSREIVIDADTDAQKKIARNFNLEFEIIEVGSISGVFTWKNKLLIKWNSAAAASEIAEELKLQGTSTVVGRIQYQSVTTGSGDPSNGKPAYILISFEPDDLTNSNIITQKKNFNALSGTVTLEGVQSGRTLSYNTATGRPSTAFGIARPLRIPQGDSKHVDALRRRIASALSRAKTTRTECSIRTIPPPFLYVDTIVSSEAGSGASSIPTLAINAQTYGFRIGMTIAKIDSAGAQTAYGYATDVSGSAVTAPLNTGNWDGYTGSEGRVRLYFPIRAGHYIYAKNLLANFTGYMFIKSWVYTEEPGAQATLYKGSGVNTAGSAIGLGIDPNSIQTTIEGEGNKLTKEVNVPTGGLGYTFEKISTTKTAMFTMVDQNTISWTGGRMVIGGGGLSYEVAAGSVDLLTDNDNKTNLPVAYKLVFIDPDEQAPDGSGFYAFSFILVSAYKPDHDNIVMGHARASKNASGRALLLFDGSGLGLFGGIDAAGEDQFTASLFKKTIQPYTTDVEIKVGNAADSFADKNRYVSSTGGGDPAISISFADNNTVLVDANTTLDLWTVSGGDAANNNKTWYIYYKLMNTTPNPDEETSDFTLVDKAVVDRTLVYADATSDSRGLLAICGTGDTTASGDDLEEIAIQAFHGKGQNITADTIAANSITANAIKAGSIATGHISGTLAGSKLSIDANTTFASTYNPSTATTLANTAQASASSALTNAATAQTEAESKAKVTRSDSEPSSDLATGDIWYKTASPYSSTSPGIYIYTGSAWQIRDDVAAINLASTTINGGLINTQRIKLVQGGGNAGAMATNVMSYASGTKRTPTATLREGTIGSGVGDLTLTADSQGGSELQIYSGDIIKLGSEDMYVVSHNSAGTSFTVVRGYNSTTRGGHSGADIHKYMADAEVTHIAGLTDPHIIMDNYGIVGYSNAYTPEFSISSEDGKAYFGGGLVTADKTGLTIGESEGSGGSTGFIRWEASGLGNVYMYRKQAAENPVTFPDGALIFQVPQNLYVVGDILGGSLTDNNSIGNNAGAGFTGVFTKKINFTSTASSSRYEFATLEAPPNYTTTDYTTGTAAQALSTVTGTSTAWTATMVGGSFTFDSGGGGGRIESVNTGAQTMVVANAATVSSGTSYTIAGSDTARYTMVLPLVGPTGTGQSLQTSGSDPWKQFEWADAGGGSGDITGVTLAGDSGTAEDLTANVNLTIAGGSNVTTAGSGSTLTINAVDTHRGIDDTPANGVTTESISSNWAYDHSNAHTVTINNLTGGIANQGIYASSSTDFNATSYAMTGSAIGNSVAYPNIGVGVLTGYSTVQFTSLSDNAGDVDIRASSAGALFAYSSSRRNKENIVDMTVDSSKIYDLVPVTFKWKDITEPMMIDDVVTSVTTVGRTDFGLIAEEVYEILPELVGKNAAGEPNSVFYSQLSVLVLAEIKKLKARIEALEAE